MAGNDDAAQQNPTSHIPILAGQLPPDLRPDDRTFVVERSGWTKLSFDPPPELLAIPGLDLSGYKWALHSWVPFWTQPGLDLRREEVLFATGPHHRYRDESSFFRDYRPAILPVDEARNPTEYAR